ncbi:MAG: polysaccharide biosynthesis tyrosine autokinase [Lachnospiraceae bacterium]|nr:polysaccharide biosynthesis tyrosine autokinase [Lachnospiraceae bacterium]
MAIIELVRDELPYEINEEMKTLRTNLLFCGAEKQVILLTSSFSGEGKSTISMELCQSLTELDKKTLLIDADMRKSVLRNKVRGPVPRKGLSHFLSGQCELKDLIYKTSTPNLSVVFSGEIPPNPTELLSSSRFEDLLALGRKYFDYVIIDCPPIGMVVDAAVAAKHCDGCMILIEAGGIKYRMAQDIVAKMRTTGCPILGIILNKVDRKKSSKYYGKKYEGYYQNEK